MRGGSRRKKTTHAAAAPVRPGPCGEQKGGGRSLPLGTRSAALSAAGEPYCVDEAAALDRTAALPWALPPLLRAATAPEPLRPASCTRWKLMTLRR